ncbi:MAG: DUF3473 domain-containing protein [Lentisphaerae bacterium]|nr:DUF3473 domain-containing protein [Lentisphaerota bacterium]
MKTPKLLLSFDIEEFDLPLEYGAAISVDDKFEISRKGTAAILDLLRETGTRATFFTTGEFALRYPELISRMVSDRHEVASHGMNHTTFEVADLQKSKAVLEEISGQIVTGFRMARLAPVDKAEIKAAGYIYESSLNPIWLPGRYCNLRAPLLPFQENCGLWQFPVSAMPGIRFPLFWLSFKNLPLSIYTIATTLAIRLTGYYNMYSHPWEYNDQAGEKEWQIPGFVVRHAGTGQLLRLKRLIKKLSSQGEFITFSEYLNEIK